jgi:hypothetical protein
MVLADDRDPPEASSAWQEIDRDRTVETCPRLVGATHLAASGDRWVLALTS